MTYLLTVDDLPVRKGATASQAWGHNAVSGHPTDSEGICIDSEGHVYRVDQLPLGADTWRVTRNGGVTYFTGNKRALLKTYGTFNMADRLEWDGWATVYSS